jgi:hypothetical protein
MPVTVYWPPKKQKKKTFTVSQRSARPLKIDITHIVIRDPKILVPIHEVQVHYKNTCRDVSGRQNLQVQSAGFPLHGHFPKYRKKREEYNISMFSNTMVSETHRYSTLIKSIVSLSVRSSTKGCIARDPPCQVYLVLVGQTTSPLELFS